MSDTPREHDELLADEARRRALEDGIATLRAQLAHKELLLEELNAQRRTGPHGRTRPLSDGDLGNAA